MLVVVYGGHSGVIHYNCHIFHAECGGGLKKSRSGEWHVLMIVVSPSCLILLANLFFSEYHFYVILTFFANNFSKIHSFFVALLSQTKVEYLFKEIHHL